MAWEHQDIVVEVNFDANDRVYLHRSYSTMHLAEELELCEFLNWDAEGTEIDVDEMTTYILTT